MRRVLVNEIQTIGSLGDDVGRADLTDEAKKGNSVECCRVASWKVGRLGDGSLSTSDL